MNGNCVDPISQRLRFIEDQIDNFYKANRLIQLPFGVAIWYYMAFCEDFMAMPLIMGDVQSIHEAAALADMFVVGLKNPFNWLFTSCQIGGEPPCKYGADFYQASIDLFKIAENYDPIESAFTYASRGLVELSLEGSTIVSSPDFLRDTRYEAYDRLVKVERVIPDFSKGDVFEIVASSVKISGELFSYNLNPKIVARTIEILGPVLTSRYSLPSEWSFEDFTLGDFRRVADPLMAIAYLHFAARIIAAAKGCVGLGYSKSILLSGKDDLVNRLVRYSGCDRSVVSKLIQLLTYGESGIIRPDPALQPIIKLNQNTLGLMPNLLISSSIERNFTVLLNKIPSMRSVYSRLVSEKEALMRDATKEGFRIPDIRFFDGGISPDLPDIDLAIISDLEKVCLILEMKWFIEPAEVREVIEKSEEVAKGVSQLLKLTNASKTNPKLFFEKLDIDGAYDLLFAVISDSFIGMISVQNPEIPIVRHAHLLKKASALTSLRACVKWLSTREYLPTEGSDYQMIEKVWQVGDWGIKWYGIRPLLQGEFM